VAMSREEALASLARRLHAKSKPDPHSDCILFTGSSTGRYKKYTKFHAGEYTGYGKLTIPKCLWGVENFPKSGRVNAHRAAWFLRMGYLPDPESGIVIDHNREIGCGGPPCVNFYHLRELTIAENCLAAVRDEQSWQAEHRPTEISALDWL